MSCPDLAKKAERELKYPHTSSSLSLPKNTGKTGKDGRFLLAVEHDEARRLADNPLTGDGMLGVTATDVLRVFGGGLVIGESLICRHCSEKKRVSHERKDGAIIRRIRANGVHVWACHFCGREAKRARGSVVTIH